MTICQCCGQEIKSGANAVIRVDDQLLGLCNRAHFEADSRHSSHVEIAHVIWCLTGWSDADHHLSHWNIERDHLADAAYQWLSANAMATALKPPKTSAELRMLLDRSQRVAAQQGREFAGLSDFIETLLNNSADLRSAQFVSRATGRGIQSAYMTTARRYFNENGWLADSKSDAQFVNSDDINPSSAPVASEAAGGQRLRRADRQSAPRSYGRLSSKATIATPNSIRSHDEPARATTNIGPALTSLIERLDRHEQLIRTIQIQYTQLHDRSNRHATDQPGPSMHARDANERAGLDNARGTKLLPDHSYWESDGANFAVRQRSQLRVRRRSWRTLAKLTSADRIEDSSTCRAPSESVRSSISIVKCAVDREKPLDDDAIDFIEGDEDTSDSGGASNVREKRFYLTPDDEIVRAPSIGQKTAERLIAVGIYRVRDLLCCNPNNIAAKSGGRFITAQRVAEWQAQSRLVCTIPWLRGTHAQLLVGAGYGKLEDINSADGTVVWRAITQFSHSRDGQNVLRASPPPELARVMQWIKNATLAEPARAA